MSHARVTPVDLDPGACCGFVERPCQRCRTDRREASEEHPEHAPGRTAYCNPCRRASTSTRPPYSDHEATPAALKEIR